MALMPSYENPIQLETFVHLVKYGSFSKGCPSVRFG